MVSTRVFCDGKRTPPTKRIWIHYARTVPSLTARIAAGLAAGSTAMFLSACGSSPPEDHAHPGRNDDTPVITSEPAIFNTADVAFANNLIPYEEQEITISRLAPDHSANSKLVAFASATTAALKVDTQVLKALRVQWKESQDKQKDGEPGVTAGGMTDNTIAKLGSLHGREFDKLWLDSMITLDERAIDTADAEVANGKNLDAVGLAKQIVRARQADVSHMQQIPSG